MTEETSYSSNPILSSDQLLEKKRDAVRDAIQFHKTFFNSTFWKNQKSTSTNQDPIIRYKSFIQNYLNSIAGQKNKNEKLYNAAIQYTLNNKGSTSVHTAQQREIDSAFILSLFSITGSQLKPKEKEKASEYLKLLDKSKTYYQKYLKYKNKYLELKAKYA
jgi:hypothetical protein